ncbi:MAG: NifU family protein [Mycobacteriales bacterium]
MSSAETLTSCGERIEQLIEASAAGGPVARDRAEEVVRLVVDLYGTGLSRVLEIGHEAQALTPALLDEFAADELVAGLLTVHGLHPHDPVAAGEQELPSTETLRSCGERVEQLVEASAASGPAAKERTEELVRLVVDLYGSGLERLLEITHESGVLSDDLLERLADDELVASLLLVHGLHPYDVVERVERALNKVRPYMGSHGGDVDLVSVDVDGVVTLQMKGSCDGCPSSAVTLELAVETAIMEAAPEITKIEVVEATAAPSSPNLIPVSALSVRLRQEEPASSASWETLPDLADLAVGGLLHTDAGSLAVVITRLGSDYYAYRDRCPACESTFRGASVERALGGATVITCPKCRSHYDVKAAGRGLDDSSRHLSPLPVLKRDGEFQVAVSVAVPA